MKNMHVVSEVITQQIDYKTNEFTVDWLAKSDWLKTFSETFRLAKLDLLNIISLI